MSLLNSPEIRDSDEDLIDTDCCSLKVDLCCDDGAFRIMCHNCLRDLIIDSITLKYVAKTKGLTKDSLRLIYLAATKEINKKLGHYNLESLDL